MGPPELACEPPLASVGDAEKPSSSKPCTAHPGAAGGMSIECDAASGCGMAFGGDPRRHSSSLVRMCDHMKMPCGCDCLLLLPLCLQRLFGRTFGERETRAAGI